jgi:hypothetical protein
MRVLGAGPAAAQALQLAVSAVVAATVGWIWWRDPGPIERSAALPAGILLSVPLALVYDLLLLTVAIAWLVRGGRSTGFLTWEKPALFVCFIVPLVALHLAQATHIPVAPLAPAALLALCVRRTLRASARSARTRDREADARYAAQVPP